MPSRDLGPADNADLSALGGQTDGPRMKGQRALIYSTKGEVLRSLEEEVAFFWIKERKNSTL